jgi:hypothetical protein
MAGVQSEQENPPRIALAQISANYESIPERWRIRWTLENRGANFLAVESVRLPHGQFKSEEVRFEPALNLCPGGQVEFAASVRCKEPAGLVTENAFLIFDVIWLGERWRIFGRVRVSVTGDGRPETATESITAQKVGFSGVTA